MFNNSLTPLPDESTALVVITSQELTTLPVSGSAIALPVNYQGIVVPVALNGAHQAAKVFIDFFAATIANPNTRQAYMRDVARFFNWCSSTNRQPLTVSPLDLASYREELRKTAEPTTVKRHFSALRSLYSYWVEKGVLDSNPVREVKTEKVSRTEGKTPAVEWEDMGKLFQSFNLDSVIGLRDRALIATMAYSFARVTAVVSLKVKDYAPQGRRSLLRLAEKGGKQRDIPVPHKLEEYLDAYIMAAGIAEQKDTPLFRSTLGRTGLLTERGIDRRNAYDLIRRRTQDAEIRGVYGCHSLRTTGITTFLDNKGSLETAQRIAGHADARTTKLYDRRAQRLTLEDLERVRY